MSRHYVEVFHTLPCGHVLTARFFSEDGEGSWVRDGSECLEYALKDGADKHDCALVSMRNPGGKRP